MRQEWSPEDVVACWTLVDGDWALVANKSGPRRLGSARTLKFFEQEGRFPEFVEEIPQATVEYVAELVRVPSAEFTKYAFTGRTEAQQQHPDGHPAAVVVVAADYAGQPLFHCVVRTQPAFGRQLQHHGGHERLADAADAEPVFR
ncbi:DUF4158 domain-containing protein [Streptomyces sp. NPDC088246]|uniref:DUF4158 domain-containing protein n=1 Tax=Streptomyces sp. NPDC088246 TaxID=3365842 RepID=UPI0037FA52E3